MPSDGQATLAALTQARSGPAERFIADARRHLPLPTLDATDRLRAGAAGFSGRNVMVRMTGQLAAVVAMLALDGIAHRLLLCPPDTPEAQIPGLMQDGGAELMLTDADINLSSSVSVQPGVALPRFNTEWVLFTSGTSGVPKLVLHSFASLTAPLCDGLTAPPREGPAEDHVVWSTFYDIRRYGGLQILLRALVGGGSMILSEAGEPVASFLTRLGAASVTHISGTPSHWRRALMSGAADRMAPRYVRLSGEMAGQDILDRLHATYPEASIGHAYASTEAGLAFSVHDGLAGFPATVLDAKAPCPEVRIADGTLHIRSRATASCYLAQGSRTLADETGFVDTGDVVERQGARYVFAGRREGVVNVGGQKVHPEEVEAAINRHPAVAMSRVWGRPSPITGTLIAADIVLAPRAGGEKRDFSSIRDEITESCRAMLAPHKVPVRLIEVANIQVTTSGKIERRHA